MVLTRLVRAVDAERPWHVQRFVDGQGWSTVTSGRRLLTAFWAYRRARKGKVPVWFGGR